MLRRVPQCAAQAQRNPAGRRGGVNLPLACDD